MARRSRNSKSRSNYKGKAVPRKGKTVPRKRNDAKSTRRPPKPVPMPEEIMSKIVLLDQDDFFGVYLDLVLFNISQPECVKIPNGTVYKKFKQLLVDGKVQGNLYFVDEVYAYGVVNLEDMIALIKEHDKKAVIVGMTASDMDDMVAKNAFDQTVPKGNSDRTNSVIQIVSNHFKIEFVEDNSTEEYTGQEYMEQLLEQKADRHPRRIYRDKPSKQ